MNKGKNILSFVIALFFLLTCCLPFFAEAARERGDSPHPGFLAPRSITEEGKKEFLELEKSLKLAWTIYQEIQAGASLRDIYDKHSKDPEWSKGFNYLVYYDGTLLIPWDKARYLTVTDRGWELAGIASVGGIISKYVQSMEKATVPVKEVPVDAASPAEKEALKTLLRDENITAFDGHNPYVVVLNPFGGTENEEINIESWLGIIKKLLESIPSKGTVLIARSDLERHSKTADAFAELVKLSGDIDRSRVKVLTQGMDYRRLVTLIAMADIVIGTDPSNAHIASALGRNSITIFVKRPENQFLYFPSLETAPVFPNLLTVEVSSDGAKGPAALAPEGIGKVGAAVETMRTMKEVKPEKFFKEGKVPWNDVINLAFIFSQFTRHIEKERTVQAFKLWHSPETKEALDGFAAKLNAFFVPYFYEEADAKYPLMELFSKSSAVFFKETNIYKFVSWLNESVEHVTIPRFSAAGMRKKSLALLDEYLKDALEVKAAIERIKLIMKNEPANHEARSAALIDLKRLVKEKLLPYGNKIKDLLIECETLSDIERTREKNHAELENCKMYIMNLDHDLNNSTQAFVAYAAPAPTVKHEETYAKYQNFIDWGIDNILDDLWTFTDIFENAGKEQLIDVRELAESVIKEYKREAEATDLRMTFESEGDNYYITASRSLIKMSLKKLLENAVKYTKKGGIDVSLSLSEDGNAVRIAVKDTGIGIASGDMEKIFKGVRGETALKEGIRGRGYGLKSIKDVVTSSKGTIEAASEVGKGSTFTIQLPLNKGPGEGWNAIVHGRMREAESNLLTGDADKALALIGKTKKELNLDENAGLYKEMQRVEDDAKKAQVLSNMGTAYKQGFEEFAKKTVDVMTYKEAAELITPFNVVWTRRHNEAAHELIEKEGFFSLSYVHEQFLDPTTDDDGLQADIYKKYGVIVGGDAVIILRDDNGDIFFFEMDAQGHGARAAKTLDAVLPYIYKKWEEREKGFLNDELFTGLNRLVEKYSESIGSDQIVTLNAAHWRAADGELYYHRLGADPGFLIKDQKAEPMMHVRGGVPGITFDPMRIERLKSKLRKGNRVVINSDGMTGVRTPKGVYDIKKFKESLDKVFAETPRLAPRQANESILKDIIDLAETEKIAAAWNDYVDRRLDIFLDGYTGKRDLLYGTVMDDFKKSCGLVEVQLKEYAGNSLRLLAFINENRTLPMNDLIRAVKENHAAFSRLPVSYAEVSADDVSLISVQYKGTPKKEAAPQADTEVAALTLSFSGAEPVVAGNEHLDTFKEILMPFAENEDVRRLLKEVKSCQIRFFEGDRFSYIKDNIIYINRDVFMDGEREARLTELAGRKASGKALSEEEEKTLARLVKLRARARTALRFILLLKLNELPYGGDKTPYRKICDNVMRFFDGMLKKEQDPLISLLRKYKKADRDADDFFSLFLRIRRSRISKTVLKERDEAVKRMSLSERMERLQSGFLAASADPEKWKEVKDRLLDLRGSELALYDEDDLGLDHQRLLLRILETVINSETRIDERLRKEISGEANKILRDMISKLQESPFFEHVRKLDPADESDLRDYYLKGLMDGELAVKGLQFDKEKLDCSVRKGTTKFGTIILGDIRVFRKGLFEYLIIGTEDDKPVVLEVNTDTSELAVKKLIDKDSSVELFAPKLIKKVSPEHAVLDTKDVASPYPPPARETFDEEDAAKRSSDFAGRFQ